MAKIKKRKAQAVGLCSAVHLIPMHLSSSALLALAPAPRLAMRSEREVPSVTLGPLTLIVTTRTAHSDRDHSDRSL